MSDERVIDGQTAAAPAALDLNPEHGVFAEPAVSEVGAAPLLGAVEAPFAAPAVLPATGYSQPLTEAQMRSVQPGPKTYGQTPWTSDSDA